MMRSLINILAEHSLDPAKAFISEIGTGDDLVRFKFVEINPTTVSLYEFWSERERNKGHGSRWLRKIVDAADRHGVSIKLVAYPLHYDLMSDEHDEDPRGFDLLFDLNDAALGFDDLKQWYEKFGFVFDEDHETDAIRVPATT